MIRTLNELIWYVNQSLWRQEETLHFFSGGKKELADLFQVLQDRNFLTDQEAIKASGFGQTTFKKYGKQLRDHLYDMTLFFNDEKARVDHRVKNIMEGYKEVATMKMLYQRVCRVASRDLAERLLRKGRTYDCPEFVMEASLVLKESVLRVGGSEKDFDTHSEAYWTAKQWLDLEQRAWDYYQRTAVGFVQKAGLRQRNPERTREYLVELEPYLYKAPSLMFHLYYFMLGKYFYFQTFDYEGLVEHCNQALAYFESRAYPLQNPRSVFNYAKVVAHTYLGQYDEGLAAAEKGLQLASEGSPNWFNALEANLYLCLHSGDYVRALDIYQTAATHKRLSAMHHAQQETWRILGAYCYILHRLTQTPLPEGFPAFKSARFLNEVPKYTRDKDGMNIAILIAHVLLLLLEGKDVEVWDRLQALAKYRERYLIGDRNVARSEIFIRLLMLCAREGFKRERFLQRSEALRDHLRKLPLRFADQAHELEIIPYEKLLELIANQLLKSSRAQQRKTPQPAFAVQSIIPRV